MAMASRLVIAVILILRFAPAWAEEEPLILYWYARPPLLYQEDGQMRGLMLEPLERAMRSTGIPYTWKLLPYSRAQVTVRDDREKGCAVGWFWSPERAEYAQFSPVFYYGQPMVAVVRSDLPVTEPVTLKDFLRVPALRMLQKQDLFLGIYIHAAVKEALTEDQIFRTPVGISLILKMIESGRGDFTIVPREEMDYLLKTEFADSKLRILGFTDVPRPEGRHLMCSKSVPADWMARIDAAISAETKAPR
jgi:polar amino acid transport system substrate-binding protein